MTIYINPRTAPSRRTLFRFAAAFAVCTVLGFAVQNASAARQPAPVPIAGAWCGITDSGGSIRFDVSADGRYIGGITVNHGTGSGISGNEGISNSSTGVADGMWIFRRDREEVRCDNRGDRRPTDPPHGRNPIRCNRPPCLPANCDTLRVNEIMIRGFFDASDAAHGNYTFLAGSGNRRLVGRYTAWPMAVAPCLR